jgi:hypothetical protein
MKITINNKEITLKNKLRSILIFEQIAGKTFNPTTMTDMILYFYSVVLANEPNLDLDFMNFMELLDEQPNLFKEFNDWLVSINNVNAQFGNDTEDLKKNLSK